MRIENMADKRRASESGSIGSANILTQLADHARERTAQAKREISAEEMRRRAHSLPKGDFAFEKALKKPGLSFICECKKASPSKGLIAPDFPYLQIAREYEEAGADAISVLTEPKWFLGSGRYLEEIAEAVSIPCLRKDFTIDAYMIYEAKVLGAPFSRRASSPSTWTSAGSWGSPPWWKPTTRGRQRWPWRQEPGSSG